MSFIFQYTCWVRHVLTLAITTLLRARPVWGVPRGYSGLLGVRFPQSATCGVGVPTARINANWNTYLFILMTFSLVCNKFNSGTLWHCYCYSLLSSCVCNFDPGAYMIYCSILLLQNWAWHLAIMALGKGIHYHHLAVPLTFFCWEPIEHSVKSLPNARQKNNQ